MAEQKKKAFAYPTKSFFVRMITRDISLEDCILDLIDNSIDGAWRSEGSRAVGLAEQVDLSKYTIKIEASPDKFGIEDNCGGMTLDDAIEHAFSFGRKADDEQDEYSIGVYGIGMKRAAFKLGAEIRVRSTYVDDKGAKQSFAVPINVGKWLSNDDPPWDFDIDPDEALDAPGVKVEVGNLTGATKTSFDSPAFLQNLKRVIARDYTLHLARGLSIFLNGEKIDGWEIKLASGGDFAPMRVEYKDKVEEGEVDIEIFGGMAAPPPESPDPNADDKEERRYGWYVVCNGRIVHAADRTEISGWGSDDWPQWHYQYSGFIGIVLFTAANASALPLTTTKRNIDTSSEVFRRARPRMREVTRKWIDYTNARRQALAEARVGEDAAKPISIYSVQKSEAVRLPVLVAKTSERMATVNYSVSLTKLKGLAKALGNITMSQREVGLKSFNYTYEDLVGEE